jgi:hypothetical protein
LLRFETNKSADGIRVGIDDYIKQLKEDQKDIYYLAAPSRTLALSSPYFESLSKQDYPVLFCYEPYDELVLMQLISYKVKKVVLKFFKFFFEAFIIKNFFFTPGSQPRLSREGNSPQQRNRGC